jgi:TolB-like protein
MNPRHFFSELQRRNVYKVAVAYGVVAWLLIQIATQTFPFFEIPNWVVRAMILLLLLGFPIALVFAWVYELTPEGIKRTDEVLPNESITRKTGRRLMAAAGVVTTFAVALFLFRLARLNQTVAAGPKAAALPARAIAAPTVIFEKSIAVLPFENRSSDKENTFFADGVQDEILTALAKIAELKVISRTSVMLYKSGPPRNLREIAEQLGATYLLEGSVQRTGNKVRVNAQLIDARTDTHRWASTYDRDLADVLAFKPKLPKRSLINSRPDSLLARKRRSSARQLPTWPLSIYIIAP